MADAGLVEQQLANCREDSGDCKASSPCSGTAKGRVCDESLCISAEAAICIARANGLPDGLDGPGASFVYQGAARRLVWNVSNLLFDRSRPDSPDAGFSDDAAGDLYEVDAITGEVLEKLHWGRDY